MAAGTVDPDKWNQWSPRAGAPGYFGVAAVMTAVKEVDLCHRRRTTQMINDGAAYADGILSWEGIGEDFAPLTWATSTYRVLGVHAPQCTRRLGPRDEYLLLLPYSASKSPRNGIRGIYCDRLPNLRKISAKFAADRRVSG